MQFWALLIDSFRESRDRKIFWVLLGMTLIIVLTMISVGFEGDRITFLFGMWETPNSHYNPLSLIGRSHIVGIAVYVLVPVFLGWIGVILMIIATADFFPHLMDRGAIEVLAAKPISRSKLFLYKYLTSMVFVLIQSTVFVGATFLVMWLRWDVRVLAYLWCIPLLVLLFSYLYCVSVLVGVKTRSPVAAILITLAAWVAFISPKVALDSFELYPSLKEKGRWYQYVQYLSWIPPKTGDIPYLAGKLVKAGTSLDVFPSGMMGTVSQEQRQQIELERSQEERELQKNPVASIGSSLLFEAVVVLLAMWNFSRKDF